MKYYIDSSFTNYYEIDNSILSRLFTSKKINYISTLYQRKQHISLYWTHFSIFTSYLLNQKVELK